MFVCLRDLKHTVTFIDFWNDFKMPQRQLYKFFLMVVNKFDLELRWFFFLKWNSMDLVGIMLWIRLLSDDSLVNSKGILSKFNWQFKIHKNIHIPRYITGTDSTFHSIQIFHWFSLHLWIVWWTHRNWN